MSRRKHLPLAYLPLLASLRLNSSRHSGAAVFPPRSHQRHIVPPLPCTLAKVPKCRQATRPRYAIPWLKPVGIGLASARRTLCGWSADQRVDGLGGEHVSDWRSWRRQLARTEAWKHWLAGTGRSPLRAPGEARRRQREYPIGYVANGPTLLRSSGCMCWNKLLELRWIERADRMRQLRHEVTLVARVLGRNAPERSPRPAEPGLQQTKWNNSFTFHLQHTCRGNVPQHRQRH